jgi:hypothetical protein
MKHLLVTPKNRVIRVVDKPLRGTVPISNTEALKAQKIIEQKEYPILIGKKITCRSAQEKQNKKLEWDEKKKTWVTKPKPIEASTLHLWQLVVILKTMQYRGQPLYDAVLKVIAGIEDELYQETVRTALNRDAVITKNSKFLQWLKEEFQLTEEEICEIWEKASTVEL